MTTATAVQVPSTPAIPMGENVLVRVEGNIATFTVDLSQIIGTTKSGNASIASTTTFMPIPGAPGKKVQLMVIAPQKKR